VRKTRKENIFGAATADGGRGYPINSFFSNVNF